MFANCHLSKHGGLMSLKGLRFVILISALFVSPAVIRAAQTMIPLRLLYPSFAGSWGTAWIAKEAGYFANEGVDVELIRVGGSTRMVAALLATAAGSDVLIIGSTGTVSPFRLMARPEIKNPADLKGKRAGITTFGSTSDQIVRMALKHFNLEPNKDVALLSFGAQPEVFAALQSGAVQAGALSFPLYAKATQLGMRELVNFGDLGIEDINGTVITTRSYIAQHRNIVLRFLRAFTRGMQRYRSDKEFSKTVLAKYGKIQDDDILEGTWQDYAPTLQKTPRPSLKAVQFLLDNQFPGKKLKAEQFVDLSLVEQLEKNGFFDSVTK